MTSSRYVEVLDEVLDTASAARLAGCSAKHMMRLRQRGCGPAYFRVGRSVRYRRVDVLDWLRSRLVHPNSESRLVEIESFHLAWSGDVRASAAVTIRGFGTIRSVRVHEPVGADPFVSMPAEHQRSKQGLPDTYHYVTLEPHLERAVSEALFARYAEASKAREPVAQSR